MKAATTTPKIGQERMKQLGFVADPMGYVDGMNLYQMEGDNPINRVDPSGLAFYQRYWFLSHKTAADQDSDAAGFFNSYGQMITAAAKKYCVPRRLLATIIFNEWIDVPQTIYSPLQWAGLGGGNGLAQIHLPTAISEGVIDQDLFAGWYAAHSMGFAAVGSEVGAKLAVMKDPSLISKYGRGYLQSNEGNIDTSAALLKKYLNKLAADSAAGKIGAGFAKELGPSRISGYSACQGDCAKVVEMDNLDTSQLAKALGGMWNNGGGITSAATIDHASNLYCNAADTQAIYYVLQRQAWWK